MTIADTVKDNLDTAVFERAKKDEKDNTIRLSFKDGSMLVVTLWQGRVQTVRAFQ